MGLIGVAAVIAAGTGCAQSAASTWAQRSPTMSPEYPAAQALELSARSDPEDAETDEAQVDGQGGE
jgi:hypothetical protein